MLKVDTPLNLSKPSSLINGFSLFTLKQWNTPWLPSCFFGEGAENVVSLQ
ncbi:hypothetical protein O9929_00305 [Vibrio lentus]|nr:hypothetical protein [Vibrio lentus]